MTKPVPIIDGNEGVLARLLAIAKAMMLRRIVENVSVNIYREDAELRIIRQMCGISTDLVVLSGTALHSYLPTVKERQPYVADLAR